MFSFWRRRRRKGGFPPPVNKGREFFHRLAGFLDAAGGRPVPGSPGGLDLDNKPPDIFK